MELYDILFSEVKKMNDEVNMIERWQCARLKNKLGCRRGVHLTGVRQSGKSTLAGMLELEKARRYTFDDRGIRTVAAQDPHGFVKRAAGETLIIDEVQKAPEILDAIKIAVDENSEKGQYLLTGSSNLLFAKAVNDSLAGRLGKIRLRPCSYGEIQGKPPTFLDWAFDGAFPPVFDDIDKRGIISLAFVGGYPEPMQFDERDRRDWFREYMEDILGKDIGDVTEVRKIDVLKSMAEWLFAHSAQFFSIDELSAKSGVTKVTVQNYLSALRALYLFDSVPAWSKSDYALLGKRPKWIAGDTGLMAGLLGWNQEAVYLDESKNGKFIESWVYEQLAAIAEATGEYEISHYRDGNKREIDFMVERTDGSLLGIEVKAGGIGKGDFRHLEWFADNLAKGSFKGIVLYSGKDVLHFGKNMTAVPLCALGG